MNNGKPVHLIATFVVECQKDNNKQLKYNESFPEIHISFSSADAIL